MKKTRFLVLALAVAVMLVGAGYAWWNQSIEITSTVATGQLDVNVESASIVAAPADAPYIDVSTPIEKSQYSAKLALKKMYPGAQATAYVTVRNTGDMKVKVDSPIFAIQDTNANGLELGKYINLSDVTFTPSLNGSDGVPVTLTPQYNILGFLTGYTFPEPVYIEKGYTGTFAINVTLKGAEVTNDEENQTDMFFTITPTFKQFNAPN